VGGGRARVGPWGPRGTLRAFATPSGKEPANTSPFASGSTPARAQPQEDAIVTRYDARVDNALRKHKRQSRIVSAVIVGLGLLVVAAGLLLNGGRKRESAAGRVMVGDDTTEVTALLGPPPHRCDPSSLAHLATRFDAGTPRPTIDETIADLRQATASRWVYPRGAGCVTGDGDTEIGLDRNGRVLWIVPVTNKRPLLYQGAPG